MMNQPTSERERTKFVQRMVNMFVVVVGGVTIAVIVLAILLIGFNVTRSMRDDLREHEVKEAEGRERLRKFVENEHVTTRGEIARFRGRIAELENFILKQGLEVPRNGLTADTPLSPTRTPNQNPQDVKEGPKPGTPGGPPDPLPPHPTPDVPGPPDTGPPINPPPISPVPTRTCIDLPEPLEDFCV